MRVNRRQFDMIARAIREARQIGEPTSQSNAIVSKIEQGIIDAFKDVDANFNVEIFKRKCHENN